MSMGDLSTSQKEVSENEKHKVSLRFYELDGKNQ
jgi:hypothetical protein